MKIESFAVIGHPIGHTMSPFIHKRLFALSGYSPSYSVLDVEDVEKSETDLRKFDGFNITIPHKAAIISILDDIDAAAKSFGSCNTVKNENGRLKGYTTDGAGCLMALKRHGSSFKGDILILGNGGAARAIAFAAAEEKKLSSMSFAVREGSESKAEKLKSDICNLTGFTNITVLTYNELSNEKKNYSLLINTTSVGMYPNTGISLVGEEVVNRCDTVFDAVYNPGMTELLRISKGLNKNIVPGIEMLVYQAVKAHEIWYGAKFENEDIEKLCLDAEAETARLFRN